MKRVALGEPKFNPLKPAVLIPNKTLWLDPHGVLSFLTHARPGWRANAHRPAMTLTGVFSITAIRKDDSDPDSDCDPGGFHWGIMENRIYGIAFDTKSQIIR